VIEITGKHASNRRVRRALVTLVTVLVAMFAISASASAQQVSPTDSQYNGTLPQVASGSNQPGEPSEPSGRVVGSLPFTGLDVALMLAVAALVAGSGLALRRATRSAGERR
jgi:hypothetical protein